MQHQAPFIFPTFFFLFPSSSTCFNPLGKGEWRTKTVLVHLTGIFCIWLIFSNMDQYIGLGHILMISANFLAIFCLLWTQTDKYQFIVTAMADSSSYQPIFWTLQINPRISGFFHLLNTVKNNNIPLSTSYELQRQVIEQWIHGFFSNNHSTPITNTNAMSSLIPYQGHISLLQNSETDQRNLEKQQFHWLEPASFKLERWTNNRGHDLSFRILSPVRET